MTRPIYTHCATGTTQEISLVAVDERSPIHGANHEYLAQWGSIGKLRIRFQKDPVPEVGVNGVTIETLLAIAKDRLEGFQGGNFPCDENAVALAHVNAALAILKKRTQARIARGVEGKRLL